MTRSFKIAAIAGDGIGKEVLPEGIKVLEAAARRFGPALEFTQFGWANCDYYLMKDDFTPPCASGAAHRHTLPRQSPVRTS